MHHLTPSSQALALLPPQHGSPAPEPQPQAAEAAKAAEETKVAAAARVAGAAKAAAAAKVADAAEAAVAEEAAVEARVAAAVEARVAEVAKAAATAKVVEAAAAGAAARGAPALLQVAPPGQPSPHELQHTMSDGVLSNEAAPKEGGASARMPARRASSSGELRRSSLAKGAGPSWDCAIGDASTVVEATGHAPPPPPPPPLLPGRSSLYDVRHVQPGLPPPLPGGPPVTRIVPPPSLEDAFPPQDAPFVTPRTASLLPPMPPVATPRSGSLPPPLPGGPPVRLLPDPGC